MRIMKKADKNTVELRIKELATLLIGGNCREDIVLFCSDKWNIGERQSDKYILRAKELVEKSVQRKVEYEYSKAVRRYEGLYKLSIERHDYKLAVQINKELAAMQGIYKLEVEHSGSVQFICNIPD